MDIFKSMEERVAYVEALILIATAGEKITGSLKEYIPPVLARYGVPEEFVDKIWNKMKRERDLAEILEPIKDNNQKSLLIQELVAFIYLSGKYHEEKSRLIEVCKILRITTKLEQIKEMVIQNIKQQNNN